MKVQEGGDAGRRISSLELSPLLSALPFQLPSLLPSYSAQFLYLCKVWEEQIGKRVELDWILGRIYLL